MVMSYTKELPTAGVEPEICINLASHVGASKRWRMQFSTIVSFLIYIV